MTSDGPRDSCFLYSVQSVIRGYHEYKSLWSDPMLGEELEYKKELENSRENW